VFTNCEAVTLFVNGKAVGTKNVERFEVPSFEIPFEAGVLSAVGIKDGKEYTCEIRSAGKTSEIRVTDIEDCGEDGVGIIELSAYDENGVFCPLDSTKVTFDLTRGMTVGVGNGDPACFDYEQKPIREEFIHILHFADENGMFAVPTKAENHGIRRYDELVKNTPQPWLHEGERIIAKYKLTVDEPQIRELTTTVCDADGFEYIEFERFGGDTEVFINGELVGDNHPKCRADWPNTRPYRFYYDFGEGEYGIKLVSKLTRSANGYSLPISGSVKLGRRVNEPLEVRLHYGKARIFVKGAHAEDIKLTK